MRRLIVFNHVTLDGYFADANNAMSWAKPGNDDPEYAAFVRENASGGGELLFGRITYAMMASYWPTPIADQHAPEVARGMNTMAKVVFSRTLQKSRLEQHPPPQGRSGHRSPQAEGGVRPGHVHPRQWQHRRPARTRKSD